MRPCGEKKVSPRRCGTLVRLTSFSALSDNAVHDSGSITSRSVSHRDSGPALHVVQGAHEKATRGERSIRPLHLPEMHLSAHDQAWTQAVRSRALKSRAPSGNHLPAGFLSTRLLSLTG